MKVTRTVVGLLLLLLAVVAYFVGGSYLSHRYKADAPVGPYVLLPLWVIAALYVYWSNIYKAVSWRELVKFSIYCAVCFGLLLIGLAVSFYWIVRVFGE